ncbi:MAG: DNA polymerase III subunit beta [Candidatus Kerfeldbacteria bacterium RIFCSPHIGHO2_02_FULL_42_14]|uniref:Beta sliding clamp n=1 Tax=Candidatus Kerfeldbacteria bacterium RIFCSPHIGHO2_02_FULL_42_14 TaxID=1798540 RepID=A0A1G2ARY9_9BACT|nr:MAG: DNA polymerase III subunit beta [Candidatus Kerfeldbacteria bacterium RIFCSPHIGHO2_02_FULL_42_14]OGY80934.1 MAG: DNA polymerase III subunit beta [Candidatus Kerfeldbacteria bacterium RIFCSPHIGHO2_12_FULL_42_13]OGY84168.1 MAG: DNA polymerase III subunit beta [Candidatus Kerfeldbacteria bacterium RIFCSPLOWO2_02_FULL_42_19]OGY87299.1 MAG: DNA polymerase III subunit beta [Candidatus Kerfeldbacteria bacterium RIFCSPLOWO2_12_FULL_43_9]
MKFSCLQENFKKGLIIVSHITGKTVNLPILSNVLIRAQEGKIECITTNLDIGIKIFIRGKIEEEGEFTVPAQLLNNYIGLLPHERIDVQSDDKNLILSAGSSQSKIRGENAGEFPLVPEIEKDCVFEVQLSQFREALSRTIIAAATDETRPELCGALFSFSDSKLTIAATDSFRLAECVIPLLSGAASKKCLIPLATLQELLRVLAITEDEKLSVYVAENQILFSFDTVELVSRLLAHQYPDYKQIIPREFRTQATLPVQECIQTIKAASLFTKAGINDIALEVKVQESILKVSAVNNQLGENVATLPIQVRGEDNAVVLNYRFLLDGLQTLQSETGFLGVMQGTSPAILKPEHGEGFLYVIMPIRQ